MRSLAGWSNQAILGGRWGKIGGGCSFAWSDQGSKAPLIKEAFKPSPEGRHKAGSGKIWATGER